MKGKAGIAKGRSEDFCFKWQGLFQPRIASDGMSEACLSSDLGGIENILFSYA
ncbi:hypothetical protein [Mesorhizobium sangaii]|uniref:Uncharacterized protein n=1 Tax=Mesorhizobium sangaii TaxID=505389 RepID=A0A841PQW8_9HYPH|nr:hypothetical protein [Mesorhizobium sangaii]MBB6413010.1 hypothetical protein [Mesorhizobium sangaii]